MNTHHEINRGNGQFDNANDKENNCNTNSLKYYASKYNMTEEAVYAALESVGNNESLLEGFLRKNTGLRGHG